MVKLPLFVISFISLPFLAAAFATASSSLNTVNSKTSSTDSLLKMSESKIPDVVCPHPFSQLPGDPSLLLVTNLDLGDKKMEIMKECSKAISKATGKPESYIGVSITDKASVIFGGSDEPCALGNMYSIGAIGMESNGKIQSAVTDLLEPFGLEESRIYINFFDMPRANVGWSRKTFAG
ncbi:Tautomerase/MIF superfamily protein [Nitzschia inconspicua]|uniref:Tautomerase/MIF superfamily protein n=1 Tax=Nitzschia inconspicua TaxID=303405 RepID=A0A9K3PZ32_9STRA|nr:Tautomerase/MIF superfamily protein [Nitzschia inconspicua]